MINITVISAIKKNKAKQRDSARVIEPKKEAECSFCSGHCNLIFSHPVTKGVAIKMDVEMMLHVVSSCRQTVVVPRGRPSLFSLKKKKEHPNYWF